MPLESWLCQCRLVKSEKEKENVIRGKTMEYYMIYFLCLTTPTTFHQRK